MFSICEFIHVSSKFRQDYPVQKLLYKIIEEALAEHLK